MNIANYTINSQSTDKYLFDLNELGSFTGKGLTVIGDIHGDMGELYHAMKKYDMNNMYFICLGDIGLMSEKQIKDFDMREWWIRINAYLKDTGSFLFFGRGNHDNPAFFKTERPDVLNEFERIYTLPDHSLLKYNTQYLFWIGGGISIDRTSRKQGISYFEDEKVVFDFPLFEAIENEYGPQIILSHGLPNFAPPIGFGGVVSLWISMDKQLEQELFEERENFKKVFDIFSKNDKLKKWYSGHYHMKDAIYFKDVLLQNVDIVEFQTINYSFKNIHF